MKQNRLWIGLGIISVLLVIVVIVLLVSSTARRALNVAAEGSEIQLRETLRSIRGETRVVIIAFDGVGDPLLREVIAEGKMPQVAALLGDQVHDDLFTHAYAVPETISIIPTITMTAWSSIFTGQPQSATGIPGNEWYAREEMKLYAPAAVSVNAYEHTVRVYEEGFLGQIAPVPTLFDLVPLRAHVSPVLMHRGVDVLNVPGPEDIPETFGRVSLGVLEDEPVEHNVFASLDTKAVRNAVRSIEEHGVPDLQVIYVAPLPPGVCALKKRPSGAAVGYIARLPVSDCHSYAPTRASPLSAANRAAEGAQGQPHTNRSKHGDNRNAVCQHQGWLRPKRQRAHGVNKIRGGIKQYQRAHPGRQHIKGIQSVGRKQHWQVEQKDHAVVAHNAARYGCDGQRQATEAKRKQCHQQQRYQPSQWIACQAYTHQHADHQHQQRLQQRLGGGTGGIAQQNAQAWDGRDKILAGDTA